MPVLRLYHQVPGVFAGPVAGGAGAAATVRSSGQQYHRRRAAHPRAPVQGEHNPPTHSRRLMKYENVTQSY
eukprot:1186761-Prorocentrum_minimum.AAC.1